MDLDFACDVDLNLDGDPIQEFLRMKLEEIQHANRKLEQELTDKNKLLAECLELSSASANSKYLEIVDVWSRIHNDRFVIGVHVRNCSELGSVNVKSVLLNWNSSNSNTYRRKIFDFHQSTNLPTLEEIPLESDEIQTDSVLVVAVDKPDFSKQISYEICGILTDGDRQIPIPAVTVKVEDFLGHSLKIKTADLLASDTKSLLACVVANNGTKLVGRLRDDSDIITSLWMQCGFRNISSNSTKQLFIVSDMCDKLNGSLMEVGSLHDGIFNLRIWSLNEDCSLEILHHMYGKIPSICVVPDSHEIYLQQLNWTEALCGHDNDTNRERFSEALKKQLEFVQTFCKDRMNQCGHETYLSFRRQLNQLQYEADVAYLKCSSCEM